MADLNTMVYTKTYMHTQRKIKKPFNGLTSKDIRNKRLVFPHSVKRVEIEETNSSWVFLTGKYAYKVKKQVKLPFLDFSTVEHRKWSCQEEVRLNRRLSPEVYEGVIPLMVNDNEIVFGDVLGEDDYSVKMVQLPNERRFDKLLTRGSVGKDEIIAIAKLLNDFHSNAEIETGESTPLEIRLDGLEQSMGMVVSNASVIKKTVERFIRFVDDNKEQLVKRLHNGRIREGHGDLKLENVFYLEKPVIIDSVEFNKAFRCIDVGADIAFLAIGLDFYGKERLAELFVERYKDFSQDVEIPKLMDYYKCHRAIVMAKTLTMEYLRRPSEEKRTQIKRFLELAGQYANLL